MLNMNNFLPTCLKHYEYIPQQKFTVFLTMDELNLKFLSAK